MLGDENYILYWILGFSWIEFFWEFYLAFRQHNVYLITKEVPKDFEGLISPETFEKARSYGIDKSRYGIIHGFLGQILQTAKVCFFLCYNAWMWGGDLAEKSGFERTEIVTTAYFIVIMNVIDSIVSLPFNIYETFVLEEKHGFNKQTAAFYVKDKIKVFIVSTLLMVPLGCITVYIIHVGGDYFFIYLWAFSMAMIFFFMTVYADYIAPLFDKYTPLPDGELKTKVEELAASIEFPLYKLYLVEGSKRSAHSNAYFYGFFKNKRIVLFDTLVKDNSSPDDDAKGDGAPKKGCDTEEILAILSHELGHWKLNHVFKNIVIVQANLFFQFFVFAFVFKYPQIYSAFGFMHEQPAIIGLIIILQFVLMPYNSVISFLCSILSRKFEFQADKFAKSLGKASFLKKALIKLNLDNLSFPVYDWLYSTWHHSHPTLLQRLTALDKED